MFRILLIVGLLGIFSCPALADTLIQKLPDKTPGPEGYVIMIQTSTGKHCWGMPQGVDLKYLPDQPMDVEAAAKKFGWNPPTAKQRELCEKMKQIVWKVYAKPGETTQPVYNKVENKADRTKIDDVDTNTVCGDYVFSSDISDDLTWRVITGKAHNQGIALCKEYTQ